MATQPNSMGLFDNAQIVSKISQTFQMHCWATLSQMTSKNIH
jgi:hypothetical protein